jgi:hypothetical protein
MANPTQIQIDKFTTNITNWDTIINGDVNTTVTIDSGTVKSISAYLNELTAVNPRGNWATSTLYARKDIVVESTVVYICIVEHTSSTFSTDLAAGYWGAYQIDPTSAVTLLNDLTVTGDLVVNGTTTQIDSTVTMLTDPILTLAKDTQTVNDGKDRGIEFKYYDTSEKLGYFGWDRSENAFTFIPEATNGSEVVSGSVGDAIFANVTGTLITAAQTNITSLGTLTSLTISGNLTVDTNTLFVDSSTNNVGIGTSSPDVNLEIATSTSDTGVSLKLNGNRSSNGDVGSIIFENASDSVAMIRASRVGGNNDAADMQFFTQATGGSNTERMRIDSTGNVGIGTTSPRAILDLKNTGDGTLNTTASNYQILLEAPQGTGDYGRNIGWAIGSGTVNASINAVDAGASNATGLVFSTGAESGMTEAMRIDSSGNVGIGTTSPSRLFHIESTAAVLLVKASGDNQARMILNAGATSDCRIELEDNGSTIWTFGMDSSNSNAFVISNSGSLGTDDALQISTSQNVTIPNGLFGFGSAASLTISSGAITVTKSFHMLNTEGNAGSDTVVNINGGLTGDILVLKQQFQTRNISFTDGAGNLRLAGNFNMNTQNDTLTLIKFNNVWVELSRRDN